MGYKSVCLDCKKCLNRPIDTGSGRLYPCSECGKPMIQLSHRFRPPIKTDDKKWEVVRYFVENGFYYDHVFQKMEGSVLEGYAEYPETLRDAKEFVEKYKAQSRQ